MTRECEATVPDSMHGSLTRKSPTGPRAAYLYITMRCNLRCRHCWVESSPAVLADGEMEVEDYQRLLSRLKEGGLEFVKITGGEPAVRPHVLVGLLQVCRNLGMWVSVESNGVLLDKAMLKLFRQFGVHNLSISLDFPDPLPHDAFRGQGGAFRATVDTIRTARALGLNLVVVSTVLAGASGNLHELRRLVRFVLAELGVPAMKIGNVMPAGRAKSLDNALLALQDQTAFAGMLRVLGTQYSGRISVLLPWSLISPIESPGLVFGRCGADEIIGVLPDGGISLCGLGITRCDTIVGNAVSEDPLKLWRESGLFASIRTVFRERRFSGVCGVCVFRRYCANVCPASAFELRGSFSAPYPTCQELFEAGVFPEEYLLREAEVP